MCVCVCELHTNFPATSLPLPPSLLLPLPSPLPPSSPLPPPSPLSPPPPSFPSPSPSPLHPQVGALSVYRGDTISLYDGDLTFVGRVLAALPVDIKVGKMILLGHVFGCLSEMLAIGAALSLKTFFTHPYHLPLEAYRCVSHCV